MLRRTLLAVADRPRVRGWLGSSAAGRSVVTRFVAGHDAASVLSIAEQLGGNGLLATIDHLGEDTADVAHAAAVRDEYLRLIELTAAVVSGPVDVSVKLSAVGQTLRNDGDEIAHHNAAAICAAAERRGVTVTLDMEDHTTTEATLRTLDSLRSRYRHVGVAVQSRLRRTAADCARLATAGCRVRLCKGAYAEPKAVAFQRRAEVEQSYRRCVDVLFAAPQCYPMIATHNPRLLAYTRDAGIRFHRTSADHEYQMLYGVRPAEQRRLAADGATVRIYLPYGIDTTAYFLRRLAERPANVAFFLRALSSRD
jgi:proline dehydrogenase